MHTLLFFVVALSCLTAWFSPRFLSGGPYSDLNHSHSDTPTTQKSTKHTHNHNHSQLEVLSTSNEKNTSSIIRQMEIVTTWWEPYIESISQPFQPWNGTEWCHDVVLSASSERENKRYGLMLAEVFKAASSTSAGVTK
jgi:hypothetical protein